MTDTVLDLFKLTGRRAIVTGGSGGIGLAIAKALGEAGALVALVSRTRTRLEAAATEVPNSVAVPADVMTIDPGQLVDECEAALGGPIGMILAAVGSLADEIFSRGPAAGAAAYAAAERRDRSLIG